MRLLVGALAALVLATGPAVLTATPAQAATASVSLTPSAATAESNVPVTFTLSVTCNGPGTCDGLQVSFPANAVTGNGSRTDLSSWIGNSSCGAVTRSVTGGQVVFTYPTFAPGTQNCTFPVRAPEYTTLNGAVATLTPTVSGPGLPTVTGAAAQLTLVAGHNVSMGASATTRVLPGAETTFSIAFNCGANGEYTGDIGLSALRIVATLPSNFAFTSYATRNNLPGTFTTVPAVGSGGGTLVYEDPTGATCGNPPLSPTNTVLITVRGTIPGGVGTQACVSASSTFTYIDRTASESAATSTTPCTTVVDLRTVVTKNGSTRSLGNGGQYTFNGFTYPYTFPGDWDQSGESVFYTISVSTQPTSIASGISYLINDPLPCLDNVVAEVYVSNDSGVPCANPAFIPNRVTAAGFTPSETDLIRLHQADGSVTEVPFAAGGWTIPTTGSPVSEIEIPAFASEGSNSTGAITFRVTGYAAPAAQPDRLMRNVLTSQPYLAGTTETLGTPQVSTANVLIVDQQSDPTDAGATVIQPALVSTMTGTCVASVALRTSTASRLTALEITKASSDAIYLDYLAPAGATVTSTTTINFQLAGATNGHSFSSGPIAATIVPDHAGTGRTLYQWAIPAGVVTVPGVYRVGAWNLALDLGPGCAGTYHNDMTLGYGAPILRCLNGSTASVPPLEPAQSPDLRSNASPLAGNYCGASAPLALSAENPGFTLLKTVQGSLDAGPAPEGTNGVVGASGGEATYSVTFSNTGDSNLDDPVLYDLLPRVGDTEASSTTARDSQFAVTLLSVGALPANVSVQYSTAANPCRAEVLAPNAGCVSDWSATAPTPISTTTALRFAYDGVLAVEGGSGTTSFTVTFDVATPAIADGLVAWNSVGANASADGVLIGEAESTRVGLEADGQPTIVKAAADPTYDAVGDTISFTYTVTNAAGVPVSDVTVVDAFVDAAPGSAPPTVTCSALSDPAAACSGASTDLEPGQSALFVATYTVTQADVDHGLITDRATVTASPARGAPLTNTSNDVTVLADQAPGLSLLKEVSPTTVDGAGDVVEYTFAVENTGNVTLTSIGISELSFGGTGTAPVASCPSVPLAPGDDVTCTASYAVTQADMDAGSVANTAVATAEFDGAGILSEPSTATVTVTQLPSLDLEKSALPASVGSAGQAITYSFHVTNDGNVTIDGIEVQEVAFSGTGTLEEVSCPAAELAPGADMTCTAGYVVTQEDIDAGTLDNTATATGDDPAGAPLAAPPTSVFSVEVVLAPALTLVKTADVESVSRAGEVVTYEFLVINNGNTTLTDLTVDELSFTGAGTLSAITCPESTLAPTEETTCSAEYTVVAADASAARLSNTAAAVAISAAGGEEVEVTSESSTALVTVEPGVGGGLASTGSESTTWLVRLAALVFAAGLALVAIARRRQRVA